MPPFDLFFVFAAACWHSVPLLVGEGGGDPSKAQRRSANGVSLCLSLELWALLKTLIHFFSLRYQMKHPDKPPLKPDSEEMAKRMETVTDDFAHGRVATTATLY